MDFAAALIDVIVVGIFAQPGRLRAALVTGNYPTYNSFSVPRHK
jgi:hypothetical protein